MKYPLADQRRLLELQELDHELARLRRQAGNLPSATLLAELEARADRLHRDLVTATTQVQDLQRQVTKAEDELSKVRARMDRDQQMVDSGVAAKVQQELQHELGSLARRLNDLEDAELEILQQQEDWAARAKTLEVEEAELGPRLADTRALRDGEEADLRGRRTDAAARRDEIAASIPPGLLGAYDRARSDTGVGAAVILHGQCQGCRLQLPPSELTRLAAADPDELEHCEECGCVLVRVPAGDAAGPDS